MKIFNWNIINETDYEIKCDYLRKDIIIIDHSTNRQLEYFKYNEMKDTYSEDDKIHDIILEIHNDKNEIVLYKNIVS
ncbi:hypothetical protein [Staphylococcus hominis]|uniref:hypothetical protein n=1 Tax=Staphylococcus hominis TaxID=1290 RepID=UPI0031BA61AC